MKQATLLAICIAIVQLCQANIAPPSTVIKPAGDSSQHANIPSIEEMLKEIIAITGLQGDFELKQADVLNIEAFISHRKRYILYNPSFINRINSLTRDKWAAMALLAHEIGHHLNGHTIKKGGSNPEVELEADEFAGFILYKLGATLEQSQIVMHYIAKVEPSKTHPAKKSRMQAIEKGWTKAGEATTEKATAQQRKG